MPRCRDLGIIKRPGKKIYSLSKDPRRWVDMVAISGKGEESFVVLINRISESKISRATASGRKEAGRNEAE